MTEQAKRRPAKKLSAETKWEIFLAVTAGDITQADAARKHAVDVSTIISIRRTVNDAALAALSRAQGRPLKERNWELDAAHADPDAAVAERDTDDSVRQRLRRRGQGAVRRRGRRRTGPHLELPAGGGADLRFEENARDRLVRLGLDLLERHRLPLLVADPALPPVVEI